MLVSDLVSDENKTRVYRPLQIKNFFRIFLGVSDSNVTHLWCHINTQLLVTRKDGSLRALNHYRAPEPKHALEMGGRRRSSGCWYRLSACKSRRKKIMRPSNPEYSEPIVKTIPETAKALRVSRSTIYRLIDSGELEVTYVLSSPRITSLEIERYLRRQLGRQRRFEVR